MDQIDIGRPMVLLVDTDGDNTTDHFVAGIGYDDENLMYGVYDTWDHNIHWFDWHEMALGHEWGIYGITTYDFYLEPKILLAIAQNTYAGADIRVQANVLEGSNPINSVILYYTVDAGPEQILAMVDEGNGIWSSVLGPYPGDTQIAWRLVANDELNIEAIWPRDGGSIDFTVIKSGSVIAWGRNDWGLGNVPSPNINFVAVAGGWEYSMGLGSNGTIVAWGSNYEGALNLPECNENFVAIAGGGAHGLGLKSDGSVVAWGYNEYGQCDVPDPNSDFVSIAAKHYHSIGLKSDGSIVAWGLNGYGQCNVPDPNKDFIAIAAGAYHSLGLKLDGRIINWGYNDEGEHDVPLPNVDYIAIAGGGYHSLGLKSDGQIIPWGVDNHYGEWDVPSPNANFVTIAAGERHSLGLKSDGSVVAWGYNEYGQCDVPVPNPDFVADFTAIAGGTYHSLAIHDSFPPLVVSANVINAFSGSEFEAKIQPISDPISSVMLHYSIDGGPEQNMAMIDEGNGIWSTMLDPYPGGTEIAWRVAASDEYEREGLWPRDGGWLNFAMIQPGAIVVWGNNDQGQCNVPSPNAGFVSVAGGGYHILGLKPNGTIVAWGYNDYGQCNIPMVNESFVALAGGVYHSLGIKSDSSIVAWGWNGVGQCNVPSPNADFVAVAGGSYHSLGLKADSTIVAWGYNEYGQCDIPVVNENFVSITAGEFYSLGLKADGTIIAWGANDFDQCNVPEPNTDFIAISSGGDHCLGLRSDGSIVAWGRNAAGECNVPAENTDFVSIAGGGAFSLALKSNGTIVAWGSNWRGLCEIPVPNQDFVAISAMVGNGIGIKSNIPWPDVESPQVEVVYPNGGETFLSGDTLSIRWIATDNARVDSVSIEYSLNAGLLWTLLSSREPNDSPYSWIIPDDIESDSCLVRVTAWDPLLNTGSGMSAELFTIEKSTTSVDEIPMAFVLHQNYPNPFNPLTTIRYGLPKRARVSLKIYNVSGSLIKTLIEESQTAGYRQIDWNGIDENGLPVASGVYFYRLVAGDFVQTKKMVLLR